MTPLDTRKRAVTRRLAPALLLVFAAPLVAEHLLGDVTLASLGGLVLFVPLYGAGALLIREVVRRRGGGWPAILVLAAAFGVVEEGLATQSLFDPDYAHAHLLDAGYLPALGIAVPWTVHVLVDKRGPTALTMRRLGTELGVEAMSLYRYVNGREDLLEGMMDRMVTELHLRSDEALLTATDRWQAYLQWLAHGVRSLARDHPKVFPLIATRHPAAPWLRPPLRSLRVVEAFLSTLISRGFDDDRAVEAYQAFSSFLLRHLLLEASLLGAQTGQAEEPLDEGESDTPTPTRTSTSTTSRTSTGSRAGCRRTMPRPSSNRPSKTFWTGSTASSANDRTTAVHRGGLGLTLRWWTGPGSFIAGALGYANSNGGIPWVLELTPRFRVEVAGSGAEIAVSRTGVR